MKLVFYRYLNDSIPQRILGLNLEGNKIISGVAFGFYQWVRLEVIEGLHGWQEEFNAGQMEILPNQEDYNNEEKMKEILADLL